MNVAEPEVAVHPHTAALCRLVDYSRRLPDHERARLKWLAWIHYSSRSVVAAAKAREPVPNFHHLLIG